ncbi:MAG: efflux RND transporter periplasmic adaptor subunit [Microscillaceae bacterium]|nr:efflux RND transporter periplasmic adaptor subunit [Microscillaceae bacterium]
MKKVVWILVVLGIIAFFAFTLYSNKKEINQAAQFRDKVTDVPVRVTKAAYQPMDYAYAYLGSFAPIREVSFGAETQGRITQIFVQEGDMLSQGQLLAKIDDEKLRLKLSSEQVALENQKSVHQKLTRDLERYENLKEANAVTDINYQQSKLSEKQSGFSEKSAAIQIKLTEKDLRLTQITAPISGILTEKRFEVGSVVNFGNPLGTITDISSVKLVALIPEADILKFSQGQEVKVTADVYPDREFVGTITLIGVKADAAHNYKVEVLVSNSREAFLRAGMYGKIKGKSTQKQDRLLIPRTALVGSIKQPQIFVAQNGTARLRDVVIGDSFGDSLEIISGLKAGESVIITGQLNLEDGTTIKIQN